MTVTFKYPRGCEDVAEIPHGTCAPSALLDIGPEFLWEAPVTDSKFKERRARRRVRFEAPATVTAGKHRLAASTKDISDRGLFFVTDAGCRLGSEIDVVIQLPQEVGLPVSGMVRCHGRVVRSDSAGGEYNVAMQIDRLTPVQQV
jgi:hypothetical protein